MLCSSTHFESIRSGIGAEKTPLQYGAFPSDPYSHTPENAGVKQPGMTGQVKEDVLARVMELGVRIDQGTLGFNLDGFDAAECVRQETSFEYFDLRGEVREISIPEGGFGFTLFQVPVIYQPGDRDEIILKNADGSSQTIHGHQLDGATSEQLFRRTGHVVSVECVWRALSKSEQTA